MPTTFEASDEMLWVTQKTTTDELSTVVKEGSPPTPRDRQRGRRWAASRDRNLDSGPGREEEGAPGLQL